MGIPSASLACYFFAEARTLSLRFAVFYDGSTIMLKHSPAKRRIFPCKIAERQLGNLLEIHPDLSQTYPGLMLKTSQGHSRTELTQHYQRVNATCPKLPITFPPIVKLSTNNCRNLTKALAKCCVFDYNYTGIDGRSHFISSFVFCF